MNIGTKRIEELAKMAHEDELKYLVENRIVIAYTVPYGSNSGDVVLHASVQQAAENYRKNFTGDCRLYTIRWENDERAEKYVQDYISRRNAMKAKLIGNSAGIDDDHFRIITELEFNIDGINIRQYNNSCSVKEDKKRLVEATRSWGGVLLSEMYKWERYPVVEKFEDIFPYVGRDLFGTCFDVNERLDVKDGLPWALIYVQKKHMVIYFSKEHADTLWSKCPKILKPYWALTQYQREKILNACRYSKKHEYFQM